MIPGSFCIVLMGDVVYICIGHGKCFIDASVIKRDMFGDGSVVVWSGISHGLKLQLVVVGGNLTRIRYRQNSPP